MMMHPLKQCFLCSDHNDNIADTLSRAPVENMSQSDTDFKNETKAFVDVVMINLPASQNRIELIKTESAKDEICRNLISYCRDGWPENQIS
jgi:hypothetical protein